MDNPALLPGAFITWLVASGLTYLAVVQGRPRLHGIGQSVAGVGVILLTLIIVRLFEAAHGVPLASLFDSLIFLAWGLAMIYVFGTRRPERESLAAGIGGLIAMVLAIAAWLPRTTAGGALVLDKQFLLMHVSLTLIGYAAFALSFICALLYLVMGRILKSKKSGQLTGDYPSLVLLDRLGYRSVLVGILFLTFGLLTGFVWASGVWGTPFHWDAKIVLSVIMWLVYVLYLVLRVGAGWRGRQVNILLIIGFILIVATYFGGNILSPTLHRFW